MSMYSESNLPAIKTRVLLPDGGTATVEAIYGPSRRQVASENHSVMVRRTSLSNIERFRPEELRAV